MIEFITSICEKSSNCEMKVFHIIVILWQKQAFMLMHRLKMNNLINPQHLFSAEKPALDPSTEQKWTLSVNDMDDDDVVCNDRFCHLSILCLLCITHHIVLLLRFVGFGRFRCTFGCWWSEKTWPILSQGFLWRWLQEEKEGLQKLVITLKYL